MPPNTTHREKERMMAEENVNCAGAGQHIEKNLMIHFNEWANEAEKDSNRNTQTALLMLRPLMNYACKFCDAGLVLGQIDNLAAVALKEANDG